MIRTRLTLAIAMTLTATTLAETPTTRPVIIAIDTSAAPELADYAKDRVQPVVDGWYPKIIALLPSKGFVASDRITIVFDPKYDGVAATSGDRIVCSTKYFSAHQDDLGAFVHELTHVVQHYGDGDRPGWLVEGIADWVRFYHYEHPEARPHPNAAKAKYSDSYRTSAAFLDWAQRTCDPHLVLKLNEACREGKYSDDLWKQYTGKTLVELGDAWKASLR